MTAEVGVLNRLGVALAADSAVTLGPYGKTITSAEKLFQLSDTEPIGIMIYGNADILEVPWETIIKLYRSQLKGKSFNTLNEYVKDFIVFLKTNKNVFSASVQADFIKMYAYIYLTFFRDNCLDEINKDLQNRSYNEEEVKSKISELSRTEIKKIESRDLVEGIPKNFSEILRKKYSRIINDIRKDVFENLPIDRATVRIINSLVVELLMRRYFGGPHSGLVFAGYGAKEHYPSLVEIQVGGLVADHVLHFVDRKITIDSKLGACIIPFAQGEMVATFMNGIDPEIRHLQELSSRKLIEGMTQVMGEEIQKISKEYLKVFNSRIAPALDSHFNQLIENWNRMIEERFSGPILEIVAALPKDELTAIAESLVNLTKFKRKVSHQQETVGGPIDVALISKGDGFVWVKRKHYFESELNPRWLARLNK